MKKTLMIIPFIALALVGCSHDSKPVTQSNQAQYLDHLASVGITQQPGQNLVGAGQEICRWFDDGQTPAEVLFMLSQTKVDPAMAGTILAGAVVDLCPQYQQKMLDVSRWPCYDSLTPTREHTMTRKHFEAIAEIINLHRATGDSETVRRLADELSVYFEDENPRFNRPTFLAACGF